jgi:hypothetical protein
MGNDSKKWETYDIIAEALCKKYSIEELSGWLCDISSEVAQWACRESLHSTPYKKSDMLLYIQYMNHQTILLMALHHKICAENEELYSAIEKGVMTSYYNEYVEE